MYVQWVIIVFDGGFGSLSCCFMSSSSFSSFILHPVWSFDIMTKFLYFRIWPITKCCAKLRRRTLWKRRQRWQRHSNNSVNFSAWEMWFMRFQEEKRKCKCMHTYKKKCSNDLWFITYLWFYNFLASKFGVLFLKLYIVFQLLAVRPRRMTWLPSHVLLTGHIFLRFLTQRPAHAFISWSGSLFTSRL